MRSAPVWIEINQRKERDWPIGMIMEEEHGNHNFLWLPLMLCHSGLNGSGGEDWDDFLY